MRVNREQLLTLLLSISFAIASVLAVKYLVKKLTPTPPEDVPPEETCEHEIDTKKTETVSVEGLDRATCINAGFYKVKYYCYCGEPMGEEIKSEPALGHKMTNGGKGNECTACDLIVDSQGLSYILDTTETYYILIGMGSCKDTKLVIPAEHQDKPVREVRAGAFSGQKEIVSVYIPDSVATIQEKAFSDCTKLESVSVGNSVTSLGVDVFKGCSVFQFNTHDTGYYVGNEINPYVAFVSPVSDQVINCELHQDTKVIADSAFADCVSLREIVIPDRVKKVGSNAFKNCTALCSVVVGEEVTEIGANAFYDCSSLLSVIIGSRVKEIGNDTFKYCHKLVEVYNLSTYISVVAGELSPSYVGHYALDVYDSLDSTSKLVTKGDFCFYENGSIRYLMSYVGSNTAVTLPEEVNYEIYSHAFSNLGITEVTLVEGITSVGTYAFKNCGQLKTVNLPSTLAGISEGAFEGCKSIENIDIPAAVAEISNHAFKGCSSLRAITLPKGVTAISDYSFMGCSALTNVNSNGITSVGNGAFDGCKELGTFDFSNVKTVGNHAFNGCKKITNVNLNSVKSVGDYAFSGVGITELVIPATTTSVGANAFANCSALTNLVVADRSSALTFGEYAFADCGSLTNVSIGSKVSKLPDGMFSGCGALAKITLGKNVAGIGDKAFSDCASLLEIDLSKVSYIGSYAFSGCSRLGKVGTGSGLSTIGERAFNLCYNLTCINIPSSISSIGNAAFYHCFKLVEVSYDPTSSGLNLNNSYLTEYALNKITDIDVPVRIYVEDNFVFYIGKNVNYLVGYRGNDSEITLPADVNGSSYEIYPYAFYRYGNLGKVDFSSANVTKIGANAFADCSNLIAVGISDKVAVIGEYAFSNCTNLEDVTLSDASCLENIDIYAFSNCKNLQAINLGKELASVGAHAFEGCNLSSLSLGSNISIIGEHAFADNTNLASVTLNGNISYIGDFAFSGCDSLNTLSINGGDNGVIGISAFEGTMITKIEIPEGFVSIKENAFNGCRAVESISLPASLTEIGTDAFLATAPNSISVHENNEIYRSEGGCLIETDQSTVVLGSGNVVIPADVKIIGSGAFYEGDITAIDLSGVFKIMDNAFASCKELESVTLGDNLVSLGEGAFAKCTKLGSIAIPGSLSEISNNAFASCSQLENVVINSGVQIIGKSAFSHCGIKSLTLGEGIELIGERAFTECNDLVTVVIPEGVEVIGQEAFAECENLYTVVIGQGTVSINGKAFYKCESLYSITLPSTLKTVGDFAFDGCKELKTIIFDGTKTQFNGISTGDNDVFSDKKVSIVIVK